MKTGPKVYPRTPHPMISSLKSNSLSSTKSRYNEYLKVVSRRVGLLLKGLLHHIPIVCVVSTLYRKVRPFNLGGNLTLKLSP